MRRRCPGHRGVTLTETAATRRATQLGGQQKAAGVSPPRLASGGEAEGKSSGWRALITTLVPKSRAKRGMILPHERILLRLKNWDEPGHGEADASLQAR